LTRIANTDADTFRKLANALEKAARGEGWRTAEAPRGASISFSDKREADCVGEGPGRRSLVSLGKCRTHVCKRESSDLPRRTLLPSPPSCSWCVA